MINSKLGVSIKSNNVIIENENNYVRIPFNSEYSIILKNTNSRKMLVTVKINGKDILDGNNLIINSNSEIELNKTIKYNKFYKKLRFIEKINCSNNNIEDCLIIIQYQYEDTSFDISNITMFNNMVYINRCVINHSNLSPMFYLNKLNGINGITIINHNEKIVNDIIYKLEPKINTIVVKLYGFLNE